MFSLGSCEDANELGLDVPGSASVDTKYEDFPVTASTIWQDSLLTQRRTRFLVGRLTDANTRGTLEARAYLEVQPSFDPNNNPLPSKFAGQNPQLDSIVLTAGFDRVYGSATQPVRLSLYDLDKPLDERTTYNSTSRPALGQAIVENALVSLNRTIRNKANTADSIQLPLRILISGSQPTAFATALFNLMKATTTETLSQQELQRVWRGLAILPGAGTERTVIGFDRSGISQVLVYYRVNTTSGTSPTEQKAYRFNYVNSTGAVADPRFFTNLRYDLSSAGAPFSSLNGNSAAEVPANLLDNTSYAQDGTGLSTKLVIPGLEQLRALQQRENIIINRAELIVPLKAGSNLVYPAPSSLYLYEANARNQVLKTNNGLTQSLRFVLGENVNSQGQRLEAQLTRQNTATGVSNNYTALLTTYVQTYVTNQLATPYPAAFILSPTLRRELRGNETSLPLSLDRATIDASNIRLRVYYSKPGA
ncbi:DUF4270 domain-containing protein [Hymenobacter latericus]|uniref:DUF4270 domain-containing protein n=1 Tax=Hymenobacter sp. YIM 151858-1 TaxID=2987688 RepID=UPI0022270716|nr:DUF4270 domain-containing protein [Hymenobacter sp. YIM 151858-1]UYZ58429.1 DUF4270 domain-containing protein [Hymenobacter sp. YIM 151858-1]